MWFHLNHKPYGFTPSEHIDVNDPKMFANEEGLQNYYTNTEEMRLYDDQLPTTPMQLCKLLTILLNWFTK
jgi:hypothetical protein